MLRNRVCLIQCDILTSLMDMGCTTRSGFPCKLWIVSWNGVFHCGGYPDLNIASQWLSHELDDDIEEVVLADGGVQ